MEEKDPIITMSWEMLCMSLCTDPDGQGKVTLNFQREECHEGFDLMADRLSTDYWPHAVIDKIEDLSVTFHIDGYEGEYIVDYEEDLDVNLDGIGRLSFELLVFDLHVQEWSILDQKYYEYELPLNLWIKALSDKAPEAGYQLASMVEEQHPEQLGIIDIYMQFAADNGSKDAQAWLAEYHQSDTQWDAYC